MKTLKDIIDELPVDRRARIEARSEELIAEEMTLRDLRKAQELTQERMAELLGIGQDSISRLESRTDMLVSTLRSYVAAMGGSLELVVRFPDRPPVSLPTLFGKEDKSANRGRNKSTIESSSRHRSV